MVSKRGTSLVRGTDIRFPNHSAARTDEFSQLHLIRNELDPFSDRLMRVKRKVPLLNSYRYHWAPVCEDKTY